MVSTIRSFVSVDKDAATGDCHDTDNENVTENVLEVEFDFDMNEKREVRRSPWSFGRLPSRPKEGKIEQEAIGTIIQKGRATPNVRGRGRRLKASTKTKGFK